MKAVVITRFGGPEVLEIQDVAKPEPGPDEILVHVRSTALNRADLLQRLGRYPAPPGAFAGEVVPLLAQGTIQPVIDSVFPIERIQYAHRRLESNETFGKVVLTIS